MSGSLTDEYGRRMRKLRVSLLDACNFRCTYCMPASATFSRAHDLLMPDELGTIVGHLVKLGIEEVRLTGGDPTMRRELVEIARCLSEVPLKGLGMTTNGYLLKKFLPDLKHTRLTGINISLDSLDPTRFASIARFDGLKEVIAAIDAAVEAGFKVKLNTVLMRQNFSELVALIEFARARNIEIRFLELMKIGVALDFFDSEFISAGEAIHLMRQLYKMHQVPVPSDSTAFKYELDNGARVGFIASETQPFCGSCSRLRLDPKGNLRACLMKEDSLSLRGLPYDEYPEVVSRIISWKPYERLEKTDQPMYQIGG